MTVLLIAAVIGIAFLVSRRKPPVVKEGTIADVVDEVVKEFPLFVPVEPIGELKYWPQPVPFRPPTPIGSRPGSIGYSWDEDRDGWVGRPELPFIPREARPDWEQFIPVELTPLPPERLLYPQPVYPFETRLEFHH